MTCGGIFISDALALFGDERNLDVTSRASQVVREEETHLEVGVKASGPALR